MGMINNSGLHGQKEEVYTKKGYIEEAEEYAKEMDFNRTFQNRITILLIAITVGFAGLMSANRIIEANQYKQDYKQIVDNADFIDAASKAVMASYGKGDIENCNLFKKEEQISICKTWFAPSAEQSYFTLEQYIKDVYKKATPTNLVGKYDVVELDGQNQPITVTKKKEIKDYLLVDNYVEVIQHTGSGMTGTPMPSADKNFMTVDLRFDVKGVKYIQSTDGIKYGYNSFISQVNTVLRDGRTDGIWLKDVQTVSSTEPEYTGIVSVTFEKYPNGKFYSVQHIDYSKMNLVG